LVAATAYTGRLNVFSIQNLRANLDESDFLYLLNEIRTMARWHTRNVDGDLTRFLDSLDEDEIEGLADYLSRQRGPVRDRSRMRDDGNVGD
jgi:hypothetical protein